MPGTQFKLDMKITDPTFPVLTFDPVIPATGALLLIDPKHPQDPMSNGAPANGQLLPNLVAEQAAKLFGSTQAATQADFRILGTPTVARTSKGGIYTSGQYAAAQFPATLIDYLIANPTHDLYVSLWGRADDPNVGTVTELRRNGSNPGSGTAIVLSRSGATPTEALLGSSVTGSSSGTGPFRISAGYSSTNLAGADGAAFRSGLGANIFGTLGNLKGEARRSYRFYLEDLTVSRRTYEQVEAIDAAAYEREVMTSGGRYYNDSY